MALPQLDEALFPVEAVNDFSAIYEAGEPATLDLSIASPPALRLPASLEAVYARLAADPVVGAAVSEKRLIVYASFADAVGIKREGERRLEIREKTRRSRAR